jgi:hypothetical protein
MIFTYKVYYEYDSNNVINKCNFKFMYNNNKLTQTDIIKHHMPSDKYSYIYHSIYGMNKCSRCNNMRRHNAFICVKCHPNYIVKYIDNEFVIIKKNIYDE